MFFISNSKSHITIFHLFSIHRTIHPYTMWTRSDSLRLDLKVQLGLLSCILDLGIT